jgi:hypothetical protein
VAELGASRRSVHQRPDWAFSKVSRPSGHAFQAANRTIRTNAITAPMSATDQTASFRSVCSWSNAVRRGSSCLASTVRSDEGRDDVPSDERQDGKDDGKDDDDDHVAFGRRVSGEPGRLGFRTMV